MKHEKYTVFVTNAERTRLLKKCAALGICEDQAVATAILTWLTNKE